MVATEQPIGLIATVRAATSPTLDGVASCCGWPVLIEANPRRLGRELVTANPECVLFWLDDVDAIDATVQLIAWARIRGARPLRVAADLTEDGRIESALRSAGAHGVLPVHGQSASAIASALAPLVASTTRVASAADAASTARREPGTASRSYASEHVRPP